MYPARPGPGDTTESAARTDQSNVLVLSLIHGML